MSLDAGDSGAFRPIVPLSAASSYFILATLTALVGARSGVDSPTAPPSADEAARFDDERCGVAGGVERWAPLHARLARGLPINALAIGSSLVGVHGGCTNPAPIFNNSACLRKCPRCCGSRCGEWGNRGWARELLEWLARTYPVDPRVNGQQRRHELYNLGEPGGNLISAIVACPQTYVAFEVHLVLLDLWTAGLHKHAEGTEKLIRHLLASPGQPTLMIVEFGVPSFIDHLAAHRLRAQAGPSGSQVGTGSGAPPAPRLKPAARGVESARERGGGASPSAALRLAPNATLSQWREIVARAWSAGAARGGRAGAAGAVERMIASIPRPDPIRSAARGGDLRAQMVQARRVVQAMYGLRAYYGLPLFSVPACLGPPLGDGSVGMGYRGYSSDGLHPTRQGALLLSRALIAHAQRGLRMAAAVAPTSDTAAVAAARLAAGTPPRPLRLPPPPPLPQAMHRISAGVGLLCFTLDRDGASIAQRAQPMRKGERRARSVADDGGGVLPTISAQSRGWEFVEYEAKSATRCGDPRAACARARLDRRRCGASRAPARSLPASPTVCLYRLHLQPPMSAPCPSPTCLSASPRPRHPAPFHAPHTARLPVRLPRAQLQARPRRDAARRPPRDLNAAARCAAAIAPPSVPPLPCRPRHRARELRGRVQLRAARRRLAQWTREHVGARRAQGAPRCRPRRCLATAGWRAGAGWLEPGLPAAAARPIQSGLGSR